MRSFVLVLLVLFAVFTDGNRERRADRHHIVNRGRQMYEWLKRYETLPLQPRYKGPIGNHGNDEHLPPGQGTLFTTRSLSEINNARCGLNEAAASRVVSGDDASLGEWPWQAWLHIQGRGFICGGSLISPRWVLTAGHCILTDEPLKYTVILGDMDRRKKEKTEQAFQVRRIVKHPLYSKDAPYNNDLALLQLSRNATMTSFVNTICLPGQDEFVPNGGNCFISGWGQMLHPGSDTPELQQAQMPVVSNRACAAKLDTSPNGGLHTDNRTWVVTETMLCAGDSGKTKTSGCYGDSGGPFVCETADRWVLQGVVSWGDPDCSSSNHYTVFARVGKFVNWIKNQLIKYSS